MDGKFPAPLGVEAYHKHLFFEIRKQIFLSSLEGVVVGRLYPLFGFSLLAQLPLGASVAAAIESHVSPLNPWRPRGWLLWIVSGWPSPFWVTKIQSLPTPTGKFGQCWCQCAWRKCYPSRDDSRDSDTPEDVELR